MTKRDPKPTHIIETPFAKIRAPEGTRIKKPDKDAPKPPTEDASPAA